LTGKSATRQGNPKYWLTQGPYLLAVAEYRERPVRQGGFEETRDHETTRRVLTWSGDVERSYDVHRDVAHLGGIEQGRLAEHLGERVLVPDRIR
jgi:hypothetical protein